MNLKTFTSHQSKDALQLNHSSKFHNGYFKLVLIDNVGENIKLMNDLVEYAKVNDLKWIIIDMDAKFDIPVNTVWFKHKKTMNTHIHIEDFSRFYIKNLKKLIKQNNIFINEEVEEDGWTKVVDVKKERWQKVHKIKEEIDKMLVDWATE